MKVYRMTVDSTSRIDFRLRNADMAHTLLAGVYYDMGYIIIDHKSAGYSNNIEERVSVRNKGHYYFIFLEDAVNFAKCGVYYSQAAKVMEFDFPEEDVYSIIGWGYYEKSGSYEYDKRAETYIINSKLIGDHIVSTNISEDEKKKMFLSDFRRCHGVLKNYHNNYGIQECSDFNEQIKKSLELPDDELFEKIINTKDYIRITDGAYPRFTYADPGFNLIKSPSITNKSSVILNYSYQAYQGRGTVAEFNEETLRENGFSLDYSKDGKACRIDYTKLIEKRDYDAARKLLKSYRGY